MHSTGRLRSLPRVLLIRPPLTIERIESKSLTFPLGLGYLAAVLKKGGYTVGVLDCLAEGFYEEEIFTLSSFRYGLRPHQIKKRIEKFQPDVIGVSCLFSMQFPDALEVCRIAKECSADIITVLGGAHPSALASRVIGERLVDYVIIGEGEQSLIDLLKALQGHADIAGVDGLGYKNEGKSIVNPKRMFIPDLDSLPFPARDLFPMETYCQVNRPHGIVSRYRPNTSIITSRGCPGQCTFCSIHTVWGRQYRARSAENVLSEIKALKEDYRIQEVQFEDDNLTLDKARARALFEGMISEKFTIAWSCPNGVALWTLDEELLELMKKSGCWSLALGIESASQRVLKEVIKKSLKIETVGPLLEKMRRLNIGTAAFFVVGFPQETKEEVAYTLAASRRLPVDDVRYYFATPYPGTELYEQCKELGLLREEEKGYADLKVSTVNCARSEADRKELSTLVQRARMRFYLSAVARRPFWYCARFIARFFMEPVRIMKLLVRALSSL